MEAQAPAAAGDESRGSQIDLHEGPLCRQGGSPDREGRLGSRRPDPVRLALGFGRCCHEDEALPFDPHRPRARSASMTAACSQPA